jgi:putative holliday junction resolvase
MANSSLGLDVGEKRIGVAIADDAVKIAIPLETINVDGDEIRAITDIIVRENIQTLVIGYPRNQSGEATAQTAFVENFSKQLADAAPKLVFQDESLTSVIAEQQLEALGKPYQRGDIDARAAAIILQDYLELH